MSEIDIFVSYSQDDRDRVAPLVEGLRAAGLRVWWDQNLPGGDNWHSTIQAHLEDAKCVVVVWTETSVSSRGGFVREEAGVARDRGVLLPVRLDTVNPPLGFREIQALNLVNWSGGSKDTGFLNVVAAAKALTEGRARPRPAVVPRLRARVSAGAALALVAGLIGFFADVASMQDAACAIPGARGACQRFGWGHVASAAEEKAWLALKGDCEGLRSFVREFPRGVYAEEADRRTRNAQKDRRETWTKTEVGGGPLSVAGIKGRSKEAEARSDTLARVVSEAARVCAGFDKGDFRNPTPVVNPQPGDWTCTQLNDGFRCDLGTRVTCAVEMRAVREEEVCR